MRGYLVLVLLVTCTSAAKAADWRLVTGNKEHARYADVSTLKVAGHQRTIWTKTNEMKNPDVKEFKILVRVDCEEERARVEYMIGYDANGEKVGSDDRPSDWVPAAPETVGKEQLDFVCALPAR